MKQLQKGIFCISIDTELLWGRHDLYYHDFVRKSKKERGIITKLLEIFKRNKISATWAVVGHLFLDECRKNRGIKHRDITRPKYHWYKKDWFYSDPCTTLEQNNLWYGRDILKQIQGYSNQEIGSHSFSHMIFGDIGCFEKCAESEIKKCIQLANRKKIQLKSFVYPRNSIGFTHILKKYGFITYRGQDNYLISFKPVWLNFFANKSLMLFNFLLLNAKPSKPEITDGLINIPGSFYYMSARGIRRYIPVILRVINAKRGIDKAIKENKIFHIWFHPIDLADNTPNMIKGLEQIIKYARKKEKEGSLLIKNMAQIADLLK